jgi:predicted enzyme related to lactoylglutathione lyase
MKSLLANIDVPDIQAGISFYRDGLGLRFARFLTEQVAELFLGDVAVYLLEKEEGSRACSTSSAQRAYERHWTPVHLDFAADDIEQAMEKALRFGAKVDKPITSHAWGKIAVLADPFGNGFCLIEFIGRGYDEIARPVGTNVV